MEFVQGGLVDLNSYVPAPVALSSAEAENNTLTVGTMSAVHIRQIIMDLRYDDPHQPFTVPVYIDSQAANAISNNDKDTKRTHHIECHWHYTHQAKATGTIITPHVPGDEFQLADIGSKNLPMSVAFPKLQVMEAPSFHDLQSKRGDGQHVPSS